MIKKRILNKKSLFISIVIIFLALIFILYLTISSDNSDMLSSKEAKTLNAVISNNQDTDVSLRDLAIFASLSYDDGTPYVCNDTIRHNKCIYSASDIKGFNGVKIGNNYYWQEKNESYYFYNFASASEVSDWQIVDSVNEKTTTSKSNAIFSATTYKRGNNIVLAYRGTDFDDPLEWLQDVSYGTLNYQGQEEHAINYANKIADKYKDCSNCKFYVTGHSLGGYLAQIGAATILETPLKDNLEKLVYFNGMGLKENSYLSSKLQDKTENLLKSYYDEKKENVVLYYTYGDPVSAMGTHIGKQYGLEASPVAAAHHNGDFDKIKKDLNLNTKNKYTINWTKVLQFLEKVKLLNQGKTVSEYFNTYREKYGLTSIIDYMWTAHETDSFLYNISDKNRSWKNYQELDTTKPSCYFETPSSIKLSRYSTIKLKCYDKYNLTDDKVLKSELRITNKIKGIKIYSVSDSVMEDNNIYSWDIKVKGILLGNYKLYLAGNSVRDNSSNGNNFLISSPIKVSLR